MRQIILTLCLVLSITSVALGQPEATGAKALVAKLPADDVAAARRIMSEIVTMGPNAIREIASALVPTGQGNDASARFALNGLAHHVSRPGFEDERAMYARALIESLSDDRPAEVKAFLISMLQRAGRDESVPAVAKYLKEDELADPAARALASIKTASAGDALVVALPDASEANRASILRALGDIRHAPATRHILPYAKATDAVTRGMALYALANTGAPEAIDLLAAAVADAPSRHERSHAVSLNLLLAQRLAEAGQKPKAVEICRDLINGRHAPPEAHIRSGALATLTKALGQDALDDLVKALDSDNKAVRVATLELMHPMTDERITALLVRKVERVDFEQRAEIVHALGRRSDAKAWAAVLGRLTDEDRIVRLAAVDAVARRADEEALSALLQAIRRADAEESKAISEALQRIPGDSAMAAVADAMTDAPTPPARVALLEALAARHAQGQVDRVFAATRDEEASVRLAAVKALRNVGSPESVPRMLDLLLNEKDEKAQAELMQSIVAVSLRNADAQKRAEPVLAALPRAQGNARRVVLQSLPQLGGEAALDALVQQTRSAEKDSSDAAVRALADWRDAAAAPHLLRIAQDADDATHRVLALRGYLRLAGMQDERPVTETVEMYRRALSACRRADDKRLAISGLSSVRHVDALKLVAEYAGDVELGSEAALAALKMVTPQNRSQKPLTGPEVADALEKIAANTKDDSIREKIAAHLNGAKPRP
jgi:HEAT repeat protein